MYNSLYLQKNSCLDDAPSNAAIYICELGKTASSFLEIKVLQTSVLKRAVCAWKVTVL